ncbi:hypothetical protein [Akkermansia sp.]|jgi:hypothetical protein|nr:hypothetical protein [Akkermansia sp.]
MKLQNLQSAKETATVKNGQYSDNKRMINISNILFPAISPLEKQEAVPGKVLTMNQAREKTG